jgi:DeoR/GlpR family transcriptional regulator of sugar metabolism
VPPPPRSSRTARRSRSRRLHPWSARRLVDRRLTVITNALDVASVLIDRDGIELIILGGVVRPRMHSMLGHLAELALRELRADTLFMGIGALDPDHGLMNDSIPEILTDRALRRSAHRRHADSSKPWSRHDSSSASTVDTVVTVAPPCRRGDPAGARPPRRRRPLVGVERSPSAQ